ncbi:MAG: hypothetical protein JNK82_40120 [Myxococcaceae bacterium]|nr:hypothetical protein [Myxococcaceae bacterium]
MARPRITMAGVTGGSIDSPRRTATDDADRAAARQPAGEALASRKHAGVRAKKLAQRRRKTRR